MVYDPPLSAYPTRVMPSTISEEITASVLRTVSEYSTTKPVELSIPAAWIADDSVFQPELLLSSTGVRLSSHDPSSRTVLHIPLLMAGKLRS